MAKLKVGIIGCGGIANQKHLPALKACADMADLVAFCDIIEVPSWAPATSLSSTPRRPIACATRTTCST